MRRSRARSSHEPSGWWVGVALALGPSACAGRAAGEFEVIPRVPTYVLHIEDVAARVRRAPQELGTQLGGVRVSGVLVRRGPPCDAAPGGRCRVRHVFADPGGTEMQAELSDDPGALEVGRTYVLLGNVEATNDASERWVFKGAVLAVSR